MMDPLLAAKLQAALTRAGVPTVSVSVGNETDRTTWRIDYAAEATAAQREQGESLRQTYNPATDTAWKDEQAVNTYDAQKLLQAVTGALWECIPAPTMTKAQLKARAMAIYKTLI